MKAVLGLSFVIAAVFSQAGWALKFDPNVPAEVKKQILDDLEFMGSLQGDRSSGLHKEIFGSAIGQGYKKFLEDRVSDVGLSGCGNPNAVACVIPFLGSSRIWLTKNYTKFSHPQVAKMMVVYHEARHTEENKGNWPHATCPTPFLDPNGNEMKSIWTGAKLAGEPACDVTPLGSYGSSLILLKNISKFCTNCTEKVKMDSGIYADDQFKRITDETAKKQITQDLYQDLGDLL